MEPIPYAEVIRLINLLITIIGDVTLSEAKTWAETKANAEELRKEGHEGEAPPEV